MYLWTGDNVAERKRQDIYRILARTRVEVVRPEPTPVPFGRLIGAIGGILMAALVYGGLIWWADILSAWIAGRP